ncbi:Eco57I restriction-modification methylase domain-containing protein [Cognataquiflexum rubidum]|uniref:Eco57I restriction-modification methylase domain-containing protein n=1 Tax=Cognataquiflexum rubidum TaxID=2922273 RepID=UPI001F131568|nr:DNA methyltransferase [Cognataquiflexum rubidum]MCH6236662.1 restriction endonuclease [Cognataquiflexum rubidum]
MTFPSISIQGNIVSGEILDKITTEDIKYQNPESFGLSKNVKVRDEIGLAWSSARGYWQSFKVRRERIPEDESGTTETRNFWMLPFMLTLGYEVDKSNAENLDGKTYAISHRASNLSGFPVHIMGINDSLDKRRETSGPRLSPHGLLQEYLNKTDNYLFAIVTNGRQLRLLRDATRLVRLTYLEFDLEKMMEEELFADFAILYRILHASRMPKEKGNGESSIIEFYHQESLASGTRIREKLSEAVESSIKRLGNGFLKHPENAELRESITREELTGKQMYLYLLRLIYRFLFLLVTEDRGLVYPEIKDDRLQKLRKFYYQYYSMDRVRKLALRRIFVEGGKHDLWENLKSTFHLFESAKYGEKLGIKPLGSGIFHASALGPLSEMKLKNEDLLYVIHRLCYFQDEQRKQLVKVNFGDLDVEEFGSVYQGLLEFEPVFSELETSPNFGFIQGSERSSSGSHYTPEELVRPLIQHSLEYIIQDCITKPEERLKDPNPRLSKSQLQEKALLAIKVCDISCGSGHILLSAARRIGTELAKVRSGEDQPSPSALRHAIRDVIRECIYGVDKNPLAVELCKVALWLEAHNPGEPLNFLDHKIKYGDAIVGLAHKEELERGIADEAFKALPGDDKSIATQFRSRNKSEREQKEQLTLNYPDNVNEEVKQAAEKFQLFKNLPENTPEEIEVKQKKFIELSKGRSYSRLKSLADMQVAQFFIPKTVVNKSYICTDGIYRKYLRDKTIPYGMPPAKAEALALEKGFFHYFLEFPEVFQDGGFDCILGNPPFLGGQKLTGNFGDNFLEFIKFEFSPIGAVDLVTYFFRRAFEILKERGFQSLISTNTIAQGKSREDGLDVIVKKGGTINHAVKSMKWPGLAAVEVALVTITKQLWKGPFLLGDIQVSTITPYLDNAETLGNPFRLKSNEGKSFQGTIVLGKGFVLESKTALSLIEKDPKNKDVLFPYLNGDDLNNRPNQSPSRWVINFFDWPEEKAKNYTEPYRIVEELVKPEREKVNREIRKKHWWKFAERADKLYHTISPLNRVLVSCRVSKYVNHSFVDYKTIFDVANTVVARSDFKSFTFLQNTFHDQWAWKYSSSLESRIRYLNGECIDTFPFPKELQLEQENILEKIGLIYYNHRSQLMLKLHMGLTKTYNAFHSNDIVIGVSSIDLSCFERNLFEKKFGKNTWNFWTHLQRTDGTCSWKEGVEGIVKLRELHKEMDDAVLEAYGWTDIQLRHDFYEVDYLPENDRVRYTIHPDARKEILKRLLELNHRNFEEEAKQGLHKREDVEAFYNQKGQPVPLEASQWFGMKKEKPKTAQKKPLMPNSQITLDLFNQPENQNIMKEFGLHEGIYSIADAAEISGFSKDKVRRWFKELAAEKYEGVSGFDPNDIERSRISFHGVIELVVIGTLREFCNLKDILKARYDLGVKTGKVYPFANNNVDKQLSVAGKSIIFQLPNGDYITLNGTGQYNFQFITEFFKDIIFNKNGIAERLIPSKGNGRIAIDPKLASGKPFLIESEGVQISVVKSFYQGPQSVALLKEIYDICEEDVNAILAYTS